MVTATSLGPVLRAARQRAISIISAVESGPPDTASSKTGKSERSEKSAFASDTETGKDFSVGMILSGNRFPPSGIMPYISAAHALLFLRDAALHAGRRLGIFAADFRQRGAGGFLLMHGGERLAEPQQRIRRLAGVLVFGRDRKEGLGSVAVVLLLEQALAQPILRVRHQALVGMLLEEVAEGLRRQRVVFAQHIAVGHVVFVLRTRRGRQRRQIDAT